MENQAYQLEDLDSVKFNYPENKKEIIDEEILPANSTAILQPLENESEIWEEELKRDNINLTIIPKQDYFNLCSQIHKSLQSLLTDEMTNYYAYFSLLFKKFRLTYSHNLKLSRKNFELESEKRMLENDKEKILERLDKGDEREKELKDSYVEIRNVIAETIKQKNDITKERDELKEKLLQIPEEIIKAAGEYSSTTAIVEGDQLKTQLSDLKDRLFYVEEELKNSQKREEMFRNKYHDVKAMRNVLQEVITVKRDAMLQAQITESEQSLMSNKKSKIKKSSVIIKELKEDIAKLQEEVRREKDLHSRIYKEMVTYKIALHESERTIKQMKNEFNARQFQITVLNLRKKKLEEEVQKSLTEIHALKVENAKISKERSAFARSNQNLEEDIKEMRANLETECRTNSILTNEVDTLQKDKQRIENEKKDTQKQMRKTYIELRDLRKEIRKLRIETDVLKRNREAILKELVAKSRQLKNTENLLARSHEEKDNLIRDMTELKSSIDDSQELTKTLKQKCEEDAAMILQLNEQIEDKNYQYKILNDMHRETTHQYHCAKQELEHTQNLNNLITQRIETQTDQINSLQEQKIKMNKQITQLKMEIKNVRSSQTQQETRYKELSEKLSIREKENSVILKNISDKTKQLDILRKEFNTLDIEQKILKSQVEEKNNELKFKDEKIKFIQQDLRRVEKMLEDRVSCIKLLHNEIENLNRTVEILKRENKNDEMLRTELNSIQQKFLEEKLKSRAMEEELQKPQNIHRWRILEADDPTRAHLITRNLKFQKNLVKMTEKLKIYEQELHDKSVEISKLQLEIKKLTDSKPDNNVWIYKKELQEYKEQMKCLKFEITMYENLTNKQQIEYNELKNEVNRLKLLAYKKKSSSIEGSE